MRVVHDITRLPDALRGGVAAVGNFDGLHAGHRIVLNEAARLAQAQNAPFLALTFEPHPRSFFRPGERPFRLTPFHDKVRLFRRSGVNGLITLRFDAALAATGAEDFAAMLAGPAGLRHVVVGDDFRFGRGRAGKPQDLQRFGPGVCVVKAVTDENGEICSSTRVRELLRAGEVKAAAELLQRPFEIQGRVRSGDRRGRTIGFPTVNIDPADYLQPRYGVYAVRVGLPSGRPTAEDRDRALIWKNGVANLGLRPTVGGGRVVLETHILDFDGDLYGATIQLQLLEFIRPEQKFPDLAALRRQIACDVESARQIVTG